MYTLVHIQFTHNYPLQVAQVLTAIAQFFPTDFNLPLILALKSPTNPKDSPPQVFLGISLLLTELEFLCQG